MSEQFISDNGRDGKYFHLMVNMADDDLNVYQYRLYGHYKRVCGESAAGVCWESTRTTAEKCRMSVGKVTSTRRELVDLGYIQITVGSMKETLAVTLQDLMETNVKRFARRSPHEHSVHHMNTQGAEGCSPHEPKNNSLLQEPIEENARVFESQHPAPDVTLQPSSKELPADHVVKTPQPPISAPTPFPGRTRFVLALRGGQDIYADGHFIDVQKPDFLDACNAIFYTWLDALEELGRKPDTSPRALWDKYREAIKALASNRRTPEQIAAFVRYVYSDKYPDNFYSRTPAPITPAAISNSIAAWLNTQKPKQTIPITRAPLYPPAVRLSQEEIARRMQAKADILKEYQ